MADIDPAAARESAATQVDGTAAALAPQVQRGTCFLHFAYEVGRSIDLDEAERGITADKQRASIRHKRRAPYYFEYQPAPLRVTQTCQPVRVGGHATEPTVDVVLYDFGAASVQYSIPLRGPLADLRRLSDELYGNRPLLGAARQVVDDLVHTIAPAVNKPSIPDLVEDYAVYQIESLLPAQEIGGVLAEHALLLAQILRAESTPLAPQEVEDALACQISFGPDDRTIIDWNAALLFYADAEDVRAVLEFANVELLELRFLDDRLDEALDRAYEALSKRSGRLAAFRGTRAEDLWRIAELQVDSALLYEGVNNALKLLGDQYLARVYRLVSQRFHLDEWERSILRKLKTVESIYDKMSDWHANRRLEVLEWIIIALIAIEILMPFVPGLARR